MEESEITALAREYAEEKCGKENESPMYYGIAKNEMEEKLRWLTTRFCLVEKDVVKNFYQSRKDFLAHQNEFGRDIVNDASIEVRLLSCMFPEIAKEVES